MKHVIEGIVRLQTEPEIMTVNHKPAPQLIEQGNLVTNIGWWLKVKGYEGKRVKLTVEELNSSLYSYCRG